MWPTLLAFRYIKGQKDKWVSISAFLASFGLMLGVITLITILAVMQGFKHELMRKLLSVQGHVNIQGEIENYTHLAQQLSARQDILKAVPILEQQMMITHDKEIFGALVHGKLAKDLPVKLEENHIILSHNLAENLGAKIGSQITLTSSQKIDTPFGSSPNMQSFTVQAIVKQELNQYDNVLCLVNLSDIQAMLDQENKVSNILLFIKQIDQAEIIIKQIKTTLKNLEIHSWRELNLTFAQVLNMQKNIMFIIISLMIIIASFNGVSSLLMLVKEKAKEIAILQALGAGKKHILQIFMIIGGVISLVSVVLGVGLGLLLSYKLDVIKNFIERIWHVRLLPIEFYNVDKIPIFINTKQVILIAFWCLILSFLGIIYPCLKALKIDVNSELRR